MINLISNAVKFTPTGLDHLCGATRRDGDGAILVSVTDTGVGIAPEDHARVFEQFGQAGDTLTDKPRGTGLGLSICREIVEHHGGRLWLESEVGQGSTFSFSLPVPRRRMTDDRRLPGRRSPRLRRLRHGAGRGANRWMISNPVVFDRTSTSVPWKRRRRAPLPARRLPIVSSGSQSGQRRVDVQLATRRDPWWHGCRTGSAIEPEDRARRPCLGHAGAEVLDREAALVAGQPGEQLRQPVGQEPLARVEHAPGDLAASASWP